MWAVDTPSARRDQTRGSACSRKSLKNSTVHFVFLPQTHLNMYAENVPNATFAKKTEKHQRLVELEYLPGIYSEMFPKLFLVFFFLLVHLPSYHSSYGTLYLFKCGNNARRRQLVTAGSSCSQKKKKRKTDSEEDKHSSSGRKESC